ncbi:class I SAM-dependent methyltransferase [Microvirga brassicacearum]|uniref:Methyltransferase domain-containing protein n=1 Tax=Microvirga brassicacearum TaxID=2580413 RepID=A0A5N3P9Q8_9HYPH|nr:class I SAM-dependent methyltransferase [Microvirga brassicacearum]KAB0266434.1 methyltransferase domain-containing protein [Microvirga brassicacearum]
MSGAKRLELFRNLLEEAHRALELQFGFELWDGSTVPRELPSYAMCLVIKRESVIAAIMRRPNLDTLINAHVAGLLDLKNGTLFDLAAQRPHGKVFRRLKTLSKRKTLETAWNFWRAPANMPRPLDRVKDNSQARDGRPQTNKQNVAYHYDVSNAFYRLFLDPEMVYTCAYFQPEWHDDLARAQTDKLDMICRKLRLKPGDRFLDIGCGWGALICHAAQHYGVKATGVTLSEEQAALAREKIAALGLQERVEVVLQDYTQMDGEFDKISSIGMFEQVGIRNYPDYFRSVHRLLRPRGLYLHHTIARRAKRSERAFRKLKPEYRALTRYIFPGGELDHLGMSVSNLERYGFEVHDVEAWREHYQRTTRLWWEKLNARRREAEAEVGPEKTRMWLLYLAGCSLAFERGAVGVNQTLASKRTRGPAGLPPSRADLYR